MTVILYLHLPSAGIMGMCPARTVLGKGSEVAPGLTEMNATRWDTGQGAQQCASYHFLHARGEKGFDKHTQICVARGVFWLRGGLGKLFPRLSLH